MSGVKGSGLNGFWGDASLEPKRKFRWILGMNGIPHWLLKTASRPTISLTEAEHDFLNYKFYFPGRVSYDELSITLADPVNPDATATLYRLLRESGYMVPSDLKQENLGLGGGENNGVGLISKKAAVQAISGLYLHTLDSQGQIVEAWRFYNAWIKSVNFDELDYSSDELINLQVNIRYDWATVDARKGMVDTQKLGQFPGERKRR